MVQPSIAPDSVSTPVYVVDDDPAICSALRVLLATAHIEVCSYATAEAFLEKFDPSRRACVLIDVRLPGMTGLQLLEHLVKTCPNVAAVVITGHGDVPMAVRAMRAGALHFMEKPIDPAALLEIVEEARLCTNVRCAHNHTCVAATRLALLTPREKEVLALLVEGYTTKVIAHQLGITCRTVEHHRAAVMHKMQARTLSHLVRMALEILVKAQPAA